MDHPGQGITQPKAYEECQQRVVGSLLSDCFHALPVVPLHLRVLAHRIPNITAAFGISLMSGLRDGTPHDKKLDRAVEETFPSSDPVSVSITKGGAIEYDHDDDEAETLSTTSSKSGQQGTSESLLTQAKEKVSDSIVSPIR